MKRCTKCGLEKDESEFGRHTRLKGTSPRGDCRACVSNYNKAYREKHGETLLARQREQYRANSKIILERERIKRQSDLARYNARAKVYRDGRAESLCKAMPGELPEIDAQHIKRKIKGAKDRSLRDGIPFDIVPEDVVMNRVCPVLGIPLRLSGNRGAQDIVSLDKVIPDKGYVKGNVMLISQRANTLKRDATIEELELVLAYMKRHAAQQDQQEQGSEPSNT